MVIEPAVLQGIKPIMSRPTLGTFKRTHHLIRPLVLFH
jgi:hypothetical protein